jgi:hypothetical protein
MAPLSKEVWIGIIVSYVLVNIILFLINRFSSYEWNVENENDVIPRNKFSAHNALFFSCAGFMYQRVPRSIAGRSKAILKPNFDHIFCFFTLRS